MSSETSLAPVGRSLLALGPSGSGKSHLLASALASEGSGIVALAQGIDELESYRQFYKDAYIIRRPTEAGHVLVDTDDGPRLRTDKPYVLAAFDDEMFYPSDREWKAGGFRALVAFLKIALLSAIDSGDKQPWRVIGLDSYSGIGELANNAMLSALRVQEPPKARGEGGAQYYLGYKNKLVEISRACRALRGYGLHWIATAHVQEKEASAAATGKDVQAKTQQMPLFTGAFRESVPSFFDLVMHTGIDKLGKHYAVFGADAFRPTKTRYVVDDPKLAAGGRIENDWPTILKHLR